MRKKGGKKKSFAKKLIIGAIVFLLILAVTVVVILESIPAAIYEIFVQLYNKLTGTDFQEAVRNIKNKLLFWQYTPPEGESVTFKVIKNDEIDRLIGDWSNKKYTDKVLEGKNVDADGNEIPKEIDENGNEVQKATDAPTGYLSNQALDVEETGLDRLLIKEMDVVYNASISTSSSLILAELDGKEINDNTVEIIICEKPKTIDDDADDDTDADDDDDDADAEPEYIKYNVTEDNAATLLDTIKAEYPKLVIEEDGKNKIAATVDWGDDNTIDLVLDSNMDGEPDKGCEALKVLHPEWYADAFNLTEYRKKELIREYVDPLEKDDDGNIVCDENHDGEGDKWRRKSILFI